MNMNKNYLIGLSIAVIPFFFSCNNDKNGTSSDVVNNPATANAPGDTSTLPKFQWDHETHDFGKIVQGERVSHAFTFINVGKSDLVISSAHGSCGCTVPEYSKAPVSPGASGKVDVIFDSDGKKGHQDKTVTLMANTNPNTVVLRITGEVEVPNLESKKGE